MRLRLLFTFWFIYTVEVGKGKPAARAKWRSSPSAFRSVLENRLTPPTLSERRCYANHPALHYLHRASLIIVVTHATDFEPA